MNLNKLHGFFDPESDLNGVIHIIGCGAIGSTVTEMLTRMGVSGLRLYDFDTVDPHNITNQQFFETQIGKTKLEAMAETIFSINKEAKVSLNPKGYVDQNLSGYVFLCVDNIDLRREIVQKHFDNPYIKAMFDFRMRLTDAQHYAADWSNAESKQKFLESMAFSHEEAKEATPVSACGTTLNVITTVRLITALGVSNFLNFIKKKELKSMILADTSTFFIDIFK